MKLKQALSVVFLLACSSVLAHAANRIAVVPANSKFGEIENGVVSGITGKVAGTTGITVIDRATIDRILKEQNFQNSDRSSLETAARIGKLVGAGQIVVVQVATGSYSQHKDASGNTTRQIGTVVLNVTARVVDVETAVVLGQPASSFQDSAVISETTVKPGSNGLNIGPFHKPSTPPSQQTTSSDPKVVESNEWSKAINSVAADLSSQLTTLLAGAPRAKTGLPLVAGIANGSVFINAGTSSAIKVGDRFQIVRKVDVGLKDPSTGQPITQKQKICVLVVTNVDDSNSSGNCQGGLPQSGDVAEPLSP